MSKANRRSQREYQAWNLREYRKHEISESIANIGIASSRLQREYRFNEISESITIMGIANSRSQREYRVNEISESIANMRSQRALQTSA